MISRVAIVPTQLPPDPPMGFFLPDTLHGHGTITHKLARLPLPSEIAAYGQPAGVRQIKKYLESDLKAIGAASYGEDDERCAVGAGRDRGRRAWEALGSHSNRITPTNGKPFMSKSPP